MIDLTKLGTITSTFGSQRGSNTHKGIDIVLKNSTIPSVTSGTVQTSGWSDSAGWWVVVKQDDGTTAKYMHMAQKPKVSTGDKVTEGQILGIQGNTGNSRGTHLHFQVENADGTPLSPNTYFMGGYSGYSGSVADWDETQGGLGGFADTSVGDFAMGLVGKVIYFICILLVLVLAAILFMKAFDINLM